MHFIYDSHLSLSVRPFVSQRQSAPLHVKMYQMIFTKYFTNITFPEAMLLSGLLNSAL